MRRYIHVHVGPCSPTKSKFACDMQEQANNFIELKLFIRLNILKYLNFNPENTTRFMFPDFVVLFFKSRSFRKGNCCLREVP